MTCKGFKSTFINTEEEKVCLCNSKGITEKNKPGHEFVELHLVLLIFGCDGMLGLLLHPLHKVLHVLEGIDLQIQILMAD